jgi:nucleoside-diphosphate-sugar epimerase
VTGGTCLSLPEVGEAVRRVLPQADISFGEGPDPLDDTHGPFDISAAARDFGYKPAIGLEEGIRSYAEFLRR